MEKEKLKSLKTNLKITITNSITIEPILFRYAIDIVDGMQDKSVFLNTLKVPYPYSLENAIDYISDSLNFQKKHNLFKDLAIVKERKMIGSIGVHYDNGISSHLTEIGYWLHSKERGNGVMGRVLPLFTDWVFGNTSLTKLTATVFEHNMASIKSLENAGFVKEGTRLKHYRKEEKMLNAISYAIIK